MPNEAVYSTQDRFEAAVNVIRTIPPEGSFQPSRDMLLRFYALYKQATEGPCQSARPPFYDVTNRAKWDSYKALGDLPQEDAMNEYVNELKKIVEVMSFTPEVTHFLDKIKDFYELVDDETEVKRSTANPERLALTASERSTKKPNGILHSIQPKKSSCESLEVVSSIISSRSSGIHTSSEETESDNESIDIEGEFQDAHSQSVSESSQDRRCSVESFKSQPESPDGHDHNLPEDDLKKDLVFKTLFPELESVKKRMENVERRVLQQDQRIIALESKVESLTKKIPLSSHAATNGFVSHGSDYAQSRRIQPKNRLMRLIVRYWDLIEERFRQYPAVIALLSLLWPVVLQIFVVLCRRFTKRR